MNNDELTSLAKQIIDVLNIQQHYFATRDRSILVESKQAERQLRMRAESIIKREA